MAKAIRITQKDLQLFQTGKVSTPTDHRPNKIRQHIEKDIQDSVAKLLMYHGYMVVRINSGVMMSTNTGMPFRAYTIMNTKAKSGLSDLMAFKNNHTLFIEIKTKKGVQSESQKAFEAICKQYGQTYVICRSLNDAKALIEIIDKQQKD